MAERTLFYPQVLRGLGTGQVQSMRSYLEHLALAHNMRPRALLKTLIERFPSDRVSESNLGTLMRNRIHSGSPVANELRRLLELATSNSLDGSTMDLYSSVFASTGLTRKSEDLAYCPHCVQDTEGLPYMRLLWDVECVRACPVHKVKLRFVRSVASCGAAESERLPLAQRPSVGGACVGCGSLGYRCISAPSHAATAEEVWIADQVSRLLALPAETVGAFTPTSLQTGLQSLVAEVYDGSVVRASAHTGLSKSSVSTWVRGARAGLPWVLQLCLHAGADVVALLEGNFSSLPTVADGPHKVSPRTYRRAQHGAQDIKKWLNEAAAEQQPPSLREFGRRHGIHHDVIRRRFPHEGAGLSKSRTAHLKIQRDQLHEQALEAYERAAQTLKARGKAVHQRTLQQESGLMAIGRRNGYRYKAMRTVLEKANR